MKFLEEIRRTFRRIFGQHLEDFGGKVGGNCLRFANPAEALGGRHLEAQRQGGLEARRLQYVGLGKFLDVFDGFLRTSNT